MCIRDSPSTSNTAQRQRVSLVHVECEAVNFITAFYTPCIPRIQVSGIRAFLRNRVCYGDLAFLGLGRIPLIAQLAIGRVALDRIAVAAGGLLGDGTGGKI